MTLKAIKGSETLEAHVIQLIAGYSAQGSEEIRANKWEAEESRRKRADNDTKRETTQDLKSEWTSSGKYFKQKVIS